MPDDLLATVKAALTAYDKPERNLQDHIAISYMSTHGWDWLRALVAEVERNRTMLSNIMSAVVHGNPSRAFDPVRLDQCVETAMADLAAERAANTENITELHRASADMTALRTRHAEAVSLLGDVEWAGTDSVYLTRFCVWCDANEKHRHADNCRYVALMAKARREP